MSINSRILEKISWLESGNTLWTIFLFWDTRIFVNVCRDVEINERKTCVKILIVTQNKKNPEGINFVGGKVYTNESLMILWYPLMTNEGKTVFSISVLTFDKSGWRMKWLWLICIQLHVSPALDSLVLDFFSQHFHSNDFFGLIPVFP